MASFMRAEVSLQVAVSSVAGGVTSVKALAQTCVYSFFLDRGNTSLWDLFGRASRCLSQTAEFRFFESPQLLSGASSFFWVKFWAGQVLGARALAVPAAYPS
jgi:hypothetical protein